MPAPNPPTALPSARGPAGGWPDISVADGRLRGLMGAAGDLALQRFLKVEVGRKHDGTVVTSADRDVEALLVRGLTAHWPEDGLIGEEGARVVGSSDSHWVIDPIDGTSAFVEGLAHWGPTVARVTDGTVVLGAFFLPRIGDYFFFERGQGAWRNGQPMPMLAPARVGRNSVAYVPSRLHQVLRLDWPGRARCLGSHAAHLCLVAAGAADVVLVGPGWSLWDTAVGLALIGAVGGRARRLADGADLDPTADLGAPFVAGSPAAVDWMLQPDRLSTLPAR